MNTVLRVRGLTKSFEHRTVLDRIEMSVEAGGLVAVVGGRDSGRSTTVRCLSGTYRPTAGSVWLSLHGETLDLATASPRALAWIRQRHAAVHDGPVVVSPSESAGEAVGRLAGLDPDEVGRALDGWRLVELIDVPVGRLRLAQREAVSLVAAFSARRRLHIADLGDVAHDPGVLADHVERRRATGAAVVLALDPGHPLAARADRVIHLSEGEHHVRHRHP